MELHIKISEYTLKGYLHHVVGATIVPVNGGISTHDKPDQMAKMSRLIDLSEVIREAVDRFYQKETISNADLSSSKDSRVRII